MEKEGKIREMESWRRKKLENGVVREMEKEGKKWRIGEGKNLRRYRKMEIIK